MGCMHYKGYEAGVEYDAYDQVFVGRVLGVVDIISFHASTLTGLHMAFQQAVDDYLCDCTIKPEPR
ncbi:hypothetical protein [Pseudomonas sp. MWU13-3659]|uniref:hypothetical protein n=1 Tax=Pseudomonas sp. MWU13-3659 TaxID=2986964 RepID=UPI0020758546|nr:hypothetical protein [Pseudomonas sp. MWU13-3659]